MNSNENEVTEERLIIRERLIRTSDFDPKLQRVKYIAEFLLIPEVYGYLMNDALQEYLLIYKDKGVAIFEAKKVSESGDRSEKKDEPGSTKSKGGGISNFSPEAKKQDNTADGLRGKMRKKSAAAKDLEEDLPKPAPKFVFKEDVVKFLNEFEAVCNEYLLVSLVLANIKKLNTHFLKLTEFYAESLKELKSHVGSILIFSNQDFLEKVMYTILKFDERLIYAEVLKRIDDLDIIISEPVFSLYVKFHRYERLLEFYGRYNKMLETNPDKEEVQKYDSFMEEKTGDEGPKKRVELQTNRQRTVLLIRYYFLATEEDRLIMKILSNMRLKKKDTVELLLETREQERTMKILRREEELFSYISIEFLLKVKLYKLFILFDKMELINIFNQPIRQTSKMSVYHMICTMIERGESVEPLCNIIIHVSETFWDHEKLMRFFNSLNKALRNPKSNWLVYIQNPPLFCITLAYFFKKLKVQLDYRGKDINELSEGMINFCRNYVENASEETIKLNLFDKDNNGHTFLDYAFKIKDMGVLETEQVEGLISRMWDLGRHTHQVLSEFMRINSIIKGTKKHDLSIFSKDFMTPIEDDDCFQLEFRFTSNSVYLKTVCEIVWPIPIIIIEFIFSMQIIQMHLNEEFDERWLLTYYERNSWFFIVLVYLRVSFIISCIIRSLAINSITSETHYLQIFYNLMIGTTFVQVVLYPLLFWPQFWLINVSQMLFDWILVSYMLFNILSMNDYGVTIRIFTRMSYVVVIFGSVSCIAITLIAYPIHTLYIDFTQAIQGQIYKDLNLFSDLYQGILTCFEFVFGAVVLVRPYIEENAYTYSMTFIMMMFSFFGNIMLANLLIAFLTSQFDEINKNAKYLTMNMQFGLIKVFSKSDSDSLMSTPFIITLPALVCFVFMIKKSTRQRANRLLKRVNHFINIFIPTILLSTVTLLPTLFLRYLQLMLGFLGEVFRTKSGIFNFLVWTTVGIFFLFKLLAQDYKTICQVVLSFEIEDTDILNYELTDAAKTNLVSIFGKFLKVINQQLAVSSEKTISFKHFIDQYMVFSIQQEATKKMAKGAAVLINAEDEEEAVQVPLLQADPAPSPSQTPTPDDGGASKINLFMEDMTFTDFSQKYSMDEKRLAPILLRKFAFSTSRSENVENLRINLEFMRDKLKNNINNEGVIRLIAFEKNLISLASRFLQPSNDEVIQKEFREVREGMLGLEDKIKRMLDNVLNTKNNFINK